MLFREGIDPVDPASLEDDLDVDEAVRFVEVVIRGDVLSQQAPGPRPGAHVKRGAAELPAPDEARVPNVEYRFWSSSEPHVGQAGRRLPITSVSN